MAKSRPFGNVRVAQALKEHYGKEGETIKVEMRYKEAVRKFVRNIDEAHRKAAESKLVFK